MFFYVKLCSILILVCALFFASISPELEIMQSVRSGHRCLLVWRLVVIDCRKWRAAAAQTP